MFETRCLNLGEIFCSQLGPTRGLFGDEQGRLRWLYSRYTIVIDC